MTQEHADAVDEAEVYTKRTPQTTRLSMERKRGRKRARTTRTAQPMRRLMQPMPMARVTSRQERSTQAKTTLPTPRGMRRQLTVQTMSKQGRSRQTGTTQLMWPGRRRSRGNRLPRRCRADRTCEPPLEDSKSYFQSERASI